MSFVDSIARLFQDPPPAHLFEISPQCLAYARPSAPQDIQYREIPLEAIMVSPLKDNVRDPEALTSAIEAFAAPLPPSKKPRPAALILPDYAARLQVLDFDTFPSKIDEQNALVRFRMKKTIPFDVESAAVSFYQQASSGKKIEVVAALMSLEIVARYEAPFRACGFQPGIITTSGLAALDLAPTTGLNVIVKLTGSTLTILVTDGAGLRLSRCVELEEVSLPEMTALVHPTLVYIEDELKRHPDQILLCGFGSEAMATAVQWRQELGVPVEILTSRFGAPGRANAGLLGYLQGVAA